MTIPQSSLGLASLASPLQGSSGHGYEPLGSLGFVPAGAILGPALATGPAAPFIMLASTLVGPAIKALKGLIQGCGSTCTLSSQHADQAEQAIKQVGQQYFAQPVQTVSMQQAALAAVDQVLQKLNELCSNPNLREAGQRCISERLVKGGTAPWCPKPNHTGCDWITLYRDPIANDSQVQADPSSSVASSAGSTLDSIGNSLSQVFSGSSSSGSFPTVLLIGGALLLFGLMSSSSSGRGRY